MPDPQITVDQDRILISGELTFATVSDLWEASKRLFPQKGQWNCDFSQVTACDSASVALLVEWLRVAQKKKIKLQLLALPRQLQSIIAAAKLETLFESALKL